MRLPAATTSTSLSYQYYPLTTGRHCPILLKNGRKRAAIRKFFRGSGPVTSNHAAPTAIAALDELHTSKSYETLYEHLAARDDAAELHLAWRFARAHHDLADSLPEADKGRKEALLRAGLAVAEAALARAEEGDAESALCHKAPRRDWVGILLGALGTYLPTKEKVANSFRIRDALQTAAEMRPADGSVQLALGEWCFKVAGIGWVEANAAKLLFGQAPESTYAEARSRL
ncbi:regulator of microtubule dynamics [Emiliania huxleyi CCMP1516]|uniref:Regulator of microtubule dynamics protein 1 n=2 Tax=Emiliania huxleyi TaxID=2903 RepID=A0A0D3IM81_EMIH1|nr:regulator of microtubule dynamics [Emiliania huxleyi CCMP1516]EOD12366.1 regulator of microtubule dynamics [Emiliania huxleyi CCMP1516]|eukprot:XP_005764795.1 regulator of microtubule dynamics [Emiliania huxleyi CCMP1516]